MTGGPRSKKSAPSPAAEKLTPILLVVLLLGLLVVLVITGLSLFGWTPGG